MIDYRLYYLDRDGHILKGFDLEAVDDAHAIAAFHQHPSDRDMELWRGAACVGKFAPAHPMAQAS